MVKSNNLSKETREALLSVLKQRFCDNMQRHEGLTWEFVEERISNTIDAMWSLNEMEKTGGEPDVVGFDEISKEIIFYDCSPESPKGRRSTCYDLEGLELRKAHKPDFNAMDMALDMGIELLNEEQYRYLQTLGHFDTKTSSWIQTPEEIRELGGALFADFRFGQVFVYHNTAGSYYSSRGFRGFLRV